MHNFQILSAISKGQGLPIPEGTDPDYAALMKVTQAESGLPVVVFKKKSLIAWAAMAVLLQKGTWHLDPKERFGMKEVLEKLLEIERKYLDGSHASESKQDDEKADDACKVMDTLIFDLKLGHHLFLYACQVQVPTLYSSLSCRCHRPLPASKCDQQHRHHLKKYIPSFHVPRASLVAL